MPGYTCVVVPAAVQHAGLRPVYVDIDRDTYNLDPKRLEGVAGDGLAAVIVQHTYGIPAPMAAVGAWAASRSLPVIEDCCHTFGARVGGRQCGTLGSFAFMSGQWNKFFSTGLGGMLLVNDAGGGPAGRGNPPQGAARARSRDEPAVAGADSRLPVADAAESRRPC